MSQRALRHTAGDSPESQLLVPTRVWFDSRERAGIPTGSVRLPWRRLPPSPMRPSLRMAPVALPFSLPFLGTRMQYSMHQWKQYEFAHAMWRARGDSASRNRSAAALLSFRGAHSPSGARKLGKSRPPSGVSEGRIAVSERDPHAHFACASATSCDSPPSISRRSLRGCLSAHMAQRWK